MKRLLIMLLIPVACFAGSDVLIQWDANPVEDRISHYELYRNGLYLASTADTQYTDSGADGLGVYGVVPIQIAPSPVANIKVSIIDESVSYQLKWSNSLGWKDYYISIRNSLRLFNGTFYATKHTLENVPAIVAIDLNGNTLWQSCKMSDSNILSNLGDYSEVGGKLYMGMPHELGRIVDLATGTQIALPWGLAAASSGLSSSDAEGLYGYGIGGVNSTNNPQVSVVNPDGSLRWTKSFKGMFAGFYLYAGGPFPTHAVLGRPLHYGLVYVPMGRLNAFDATTGSIVWSLGSYTAQVSEGSEVFYGNPSVVNGLLYVPSQVFNGTWSIPKINIIHPETGVRLGSVAVPAYPTYAQGITSAKTRATDTLNYAVYDNILYARNSTSINAIDLISGNTLWETDLGGDFYYVTTYPQTGPVLVDDREIRLIHAGSVIVLSRTSGKVLWRWESDKGHFMSDLINTSDGFAAIDGAGNVFAF